MRVVLLQFCLRLECRQQMLLNLPLQPDDWPGHCGAQYVIPAKFVKLGVAALFFKKQLATVSGEMISNDEIR